MTKTSTVTAEPRGSPLPDRNRNDEQQLNDASILYRIGSTMADVVAKTDDVVTRVEAVVVAERRRNYPLYAVLYAIVVCLSGVGYEIHELTAFLKSTSTNAAISTPSAVTSR